MSWHAGNSACAVTGTRGSPGGLEYLLTYHDEAADRRIADDDVVYLDFGPVFEAWEADFGRTYVLGSDRGSTVWLTISARLSSAAGSSTNPRRSSPAAILYDFVADLARTAGWEFGAPTAGHLIGHFPHETAPGDPRRFSIRHGNAVRLREPDETGMPRHWILEIHFIDRTRQIGGFFEQLLTVGPAMESGQAG